MIRAIAADEIHAFADMGGKFYQRMGLPGRFNYEAFCSMWSTFIGSGQGFMLGRFRDEKPVECIGAINHPDIYTAEPSVTVAFWFYTDPPVGLEAGILHNALEFTCRTNKVKHLFIGTIEGGRAEKVSGHLLKAGYKPAEMFYRKEL